MSQSAIDVVIFDALPGGADVLCSEQNVGGISLNLANMSDQLFSLLPNVGGTHFMASFLAQRSVVPSPNHPSTSNLLVLDCGQGLTGIVALLQGWKRVTFADASEEVLLQATWPNVYLNCPNNMAAVRCIQAASWTALSNALQNPDPNNSVPADSGAGVFEVILLALPDTVTDQLFMELQALLLRHLSPSGVAIVCLPQRVDTADTLSALAGPQMECTVLKAADGITGAGPADAAGAEGVAHFILQLKRCLQM